MALVTIFVLPVLCPQNKKKIEYLQVDAVLCSVSENMNLSNSGLCKTLLNKGGKGLQDECASRYNNKLAAGKVVDIGGGKLPCKVVLLANLPKYTTESTKQVPVTVSLYLIKR